MTYGSRPDLMTFDLDPDYLVQDKGLILRLGW